MPDEAIVHCQWLYDSVRAERMSQVDMLEEFNRRLAADGLGKASLSGFNRYVMKCGMEP